ncbi:MAG: DUF2339 domain-containing protein [Ignavibacteriae bacterium]|nr:DUF2339 domain-containing protein [Ignavibacteriota bacterium]
MPSLFAKALVYVSCLALFIVATAEAVDAFGRPMLYASGPSLDMLQFKRDLTIGIVWMALSVGMASYGFFIRRRPALHASIVVLGFSLLYAGLRSFAYEPIGNFALFLNYRVFTLVLLLAGTAGHIFLWKRFQTDVPRGGNMLTILSLVIVALLFIFLTSETFDGFENHLIDLTGDVFELLSFKRILTLALVWTTYSVAVTWYGLTRKHKLITYAGIGIMALGFVTGLLRSTWYSPLDYFFPILNYRFLTLCLLTIGAVVLLLLWRKFSRDSRLGTNLTSALGLLIVALMFVLFTSETIDYYEHQIVPIEVKLLDAWNSDLNVLANSLRNQQQLTLSGVWLVYSIVLMIVGIWRRRRNIRMVAIGLFGLTILKIFIYDLSFLETLYRIFSFMGLGVILLGVSYLYQRYKSIILEDEQKEAAEVNEATAV